jgi:hypothetical protein
MHIPPFCRHRLLALLSSIPWLAPAAVQTTTPAQTPTSTANPMPVREVTVFKDGHAYILRDQPLAGPQRRQAVLDELPAPVLGTFWPFATGSARIVAARAGIQKVEQDEPAVDFRRLLGANLGKRAALLDQAGQRIEGLLRELPATKPGADGELILVGTEAGLRAVPLASLRDIEIFGEVATSQRIRRDLQRLVVDVEGGNAETRVGVMYVQQGLRWIPAYRIDLDGNGKAQVQLEATLQNDLIDLVDARVHLVVGVPKFEFAGLVDPIALQQEIAQVAQHTRRNTQFAQALSNSIMTQSASYVAEAAPSGGDPVVAGNEQQEDLFVYTLDGVTVAKGERLVVPIASFSIAYRDIYRLAIPLAPPAELRERANDQNAIALLRELAAPKARHVLRIVNQGNAPFTTAPALVLQRGRILAQSRLRYTPAGATTDLEINVAVDVHVDVTSTETKRAPGALQIDGNRYNRIDLAGTIELQNRKSGPIEVEVTRRILGLYDEVGQGGELRQLDASRLWDDVERPIWWSWWNWPWWWFHHNGFGEAKWLVQLEPGKQVKLDASWHYFWR